MGGQADSPVYTQIDGSNRQCVICPAGFFNPEPSTNTSQGPPIACSSCSAGYFSDEKGSKRCRQCGYDNLFNPTSAATVCQTCPSQNFTSGGDEKARTTCSPCGEEEQCDGTSLVLRPGDEGYFVASSEKADNADQNYMIIGIVAGLIVIIVVVILVVVMNKKKKKRDSSIRPTKVIPGVDDEETNADAEAMNWGQADNGVKDVSEPEEFPRSPSIQKKPSVDPISGAVTLVAKTKRRRKKKKADTDQSVDNEKRSSLRNSSLLSELGDGSELPDVSFVDIKIPQSQRTRRSTSRRAKG